MHTEIIKYTRKSKRAYDKAQKSNNIHHWIIYKQLRNITAQLIGNARTNHTIKLAKWLKSNIPTSSDYWKILKQFIKPKTQHSNIPTIIDNDKTYTTNIDKANAFNNFDLGFTSHRHNIGHIATFKLYWWRKTSGALPCII
jgi:IS1 family transposase